MNYTYRSLVCIFLLIFVSACSSTQPITFADNKTIAHRGAWQTDTLPQNFIASLRERSKLKAAGSEFDARVIKDSSIHYQSQASGGETI